MNNLIFPIVTYACSAAEEGICLNKTLLSFLINLCNLLAGIKLIPLGQTEGQKIQLQLK